MAKCFCGLHDHPEMPQEVLFGHSVDWCTPTPEEHELNEQRDSMNGYEWVDLFPGDPTIQYRRKKEPKPVLPATTLALGAGDD